ncbi:amidohydrolase family protein [Jatrophihabitans endophyticus]|uniref:amidohydrolase family protein n=1 Tax=Jatrophihabitans endophyticus TaxID=1206085 RepID=UPI0019FDC5E8|nr:amidohydrolase family protein [Jatrophihabitans endophyticus]MBE7188100.1 amidohydrolase [Jatrophihabitans endophyticus]
MLDGRPLIDVHLHPAHRAGLKVPWDVWLQDFDRAEVDDLYDGDRVVAERFDALLEREGVDVAVVLAEYSPRVTGTQAVEDMAALVGPRVRFAANVNPHVHFPVDEELVRQLDLGAVALKVHPVHGGFAVDDRALYPAYAICQERGLPVVVHCGTSTFPGALNRYGDPVLLDNVLRDFRRLQIVLAHGGRGWWYDAAAFLALSNPNVWIELSGLPPSRLPTYYARHNWNRLSRRMIFGTDWPGIPGIAANARAVAALLPDDATRDLVLAGNASQVYRLDLPSGTIS